ncbi:MULTISPECIES: hypothetical protein [Agrobacterium]|uniref:hypothetical protein n=1 Tax=Agrobacterium TaxID=357 RepID=UPI0009BC4265|nr:MULTISPECIES: hypothetical protein [Agrobacterium]QCL72193.1 hypothetical protein CFBP5499_01210 [Agrobacterium tumefaciens]CUX23081.1 hypothetical protein AGR6A_Cc150085 [Agrobacterium sp. NCPPB 925]
MSIPLGDCLTPEDFNAIGDCIAWGQGTDNTAAFQAAIDTGRRISLHHSTKTYRIGGVLRIPDYQQILGGGFSSGAPMGVEPGCARLVFDGGGDACFVNKNPTDKLRCVGISGLNILCSDDYEAVMDFRTAENLHLRDLMIEVVGDNTTGIVTKKAEPAEDSWMNEAKTVIIRLPDTSNKWAFDVDWSDSLVDGCHFTGGKCAIDRGWGVRWTGNQFERSKMHGLHIYKTTARKNSLVIGNSFDANTYCGICIDATNDPIASDHRFGISITGNNFRTENPNGGAPGAASIYLSNNGSAQYHPGKISGNSELNSDAVHLYLINGNWVTPTTF